MRLLSCFIQSDKFHPWLQTRSSSQSMLLQPLFNVNYVLYGPIWHLYSISQCPCPVPQCVHSKKRGTSALRLLPATFEILPFLLFIIYSFRLVSHLCSAPKTISTWHYKCMLGFGKLYERFISIKTKSKACL